MPERVLIVDDDPVQRRLVESVVSRFGYEPIVADGGDAALKLLNNPDQTIDCVLLDLVMPDLDGMGVLAKMSEFGLKTPVIVQTAHGGIDTVVSAMRAGATDFVVKPVGAERLQVSLGNALARRALEGEFAKLKHSRDGTLTFRDIVTQSGRMRGALRVAEKAASSVIPVLIEGESGVGKELVARAIHGSGERRAKPWVTVNCGAIPDNLVESILFGHERGAFTGATERHVGKFVEASGGTMFLDEVGELPPAAQVKLLRAIQEGEVEPVGARKPVKVDVRVISATNRDLLTDVKSGRFREDLFYRLHVFPISLPPLRTRPEDIPELARHFVARFAAEEGKLVRMVTAAALDLLVRYRWPGNVRQLENTIFRAVVLADGDSIGTEEIPQIVAQMSDGTSDSVPNNNGHDEAIPLLAPAGSPSIVNEGPLAIDPAEAYGLAVASALNANPAGSSIPMLDAAGGIRPLDDIEAEAIRFAIAHYHGQMSEVARRLKIGRSTLYRKLESLGLGEPADGSDAGVATR